MKLLTLIFCFLTVTSIAQTDENFNGHGGKITESESLNDSIPNKNDTTIYEFPDVMPQFPGGDMELFRFINENLNYPETTLDEHIVGTIYIKFVVEKEGSISNVEVVKSLSNALGKEYIRVIQSMPKWKPAEKNGVIVRSYFTLPLRVHFK